MNILRKNKDRSGGRIIILLLLLVFCTYTISQNFMLKDIYKVNIVNFSGVITTFMLNIAIMLLFFYKSIKEHAYSCMMFHWLYCLLFLGLAGFVQLMNKWSTWGYMWSYDKLIETNLIIIVWCFCVYLGSKASVISRIRFKHINEVSFSSKSIYFLSIGSLLIATYMIFTIGFVDLFSRSSRTLDSIDSNAAKAIVSNSIQAYLTFVSIFSIVNYKKHKRQLFCMLICCACLIITFFPLSIARFAAGTIYISIMLIFFPRFKWNRRLILLVFIAILLIFPLLNLFRGINILELNDSSFETINTSFCRPDFDSYQMLIASQDYVELRGISWGKQLLSALLFFVPRQLWPNKSLPSCSEVAKELGLYFDNISTPLPAEAFLNFGLIGVILVGILYGFICSYVDKCYWKSSTINISDASYFGMLYIYIASYQIFLMRGTLTYVYSYFFCHIVVYSLLFRITTAKIKKR